MWRLNHIDSVVNFQSMTGDDFDPFDKPKKKSPTGGIYHPNKRGKTRQELAASLQIIPLFIWKTESSAPLRVKAILADIKEEQVRIALDVPLRISKRIFFGFAPDDKFQFAASVAWCLNNRSRVSGEGFRAGLSPFLRTDAEIERFRKTIWALNERGREEAISSMKDEDRINYFEKIISEEVKK